MTDKTPRFATSVASLGFRSCIEIQRFAVAHARADFCWVLTGFPLSPLKAGENSTSPVPHENPESFREIGFRWPHVATWHQQLL